MPISALISRFRLPLIVAIAVFGIGMMLSSDELTLWRPVAVSLILFSGFLSRFTNRGKPLPLYNIGPVSAAFFLLYVVIPPIWLMATGVNYNMLLSDVQMAFHQPTADDYAQLVWRYVAFYAAFCVTFAALCPATQIPSHPIDNISFPQTIALGIMAAVIFALTIAIQAAYGVSLNPEYNDETLANYSRILAMPLIVRQAASLIARFAIIIEIALLIFAVSHWQERKWRLIACSFLVWKVLQNILLAGARTELVVIGLGFVLSYHRFVKPIRPIYILAGAPAMLAVFLFLGIYRGGATSTLSSFSQLSFSELTSAVQLFFYVPTEFSSIFAGNFDLYYMKTHGMLEHVPWTIYAYELLQLIPQQFLPFMKSDPQAFYLSISPVQPVQGFFMFGPVAQAIIGLDWLELALRASLLAATFAIFHHQLLRSGNKFWYNVLYLYLLLFAYTAIRSTTFTFFYFILFGFTPIYVGCRFMQGLLLRLARGARLITRT